MNDQFVAGQRGCPIDSTVDVPGEEFEQSVPTRFEQRVRRNPGHTAVKIRSVALTYDELNRDANRVARAIFERLSANAARLPVLLLLERGASALAATLGVLKAGHILVAIDPSAPPARIAHNVEDLQPGLIVADPANLRLACDVGGGRELLDLRLVAPDGPDADLGLPIAADDPAFILYTSGSTGRPKGVLHSHRFLLHDCISRGNLFNLTSEDRWTLFSVATGQALKNTFTALLSGGTLLPWDVRREGTAGLADWLVKERITIFNSSASLYREFVETLTGRERFPNLRLIRTGSEKMVPRDVESYRRFFPRTCLLANMYSTNETGSVCCSVLDHETALDDDLVPVGRTMTDKEILLVDDHGEPVEPGEVGEILVKSRYRFLGYWRRPDLAERAFRAGPLGGEEGWYATRDLGRMRRDGSLELLGRKDSRIKIRGFAVDPTEVELALHAVAAIKTAVVLGREDVPGESRLVAYVVPSTGCNPKVGDLRRALADRLPDHLIPWRFVILESLPTLPGGKVDRQALPPPPREPGEWDSALTPPRTALEQALASIWSEVLELDRVDIHTEFLELGGDSLKAARVMARIVRTFQLDLPVQALLTAGGTIAEIATLIVQGQAADSDPDELERLLSEVESSSTDLPYHVLAQEIQTLPIDRSGKRPG
jgi:amino acid adenylation domain-containing protein